MNNRATTIAAISTAPLNAAVGLVRLSGPRSFAIADAVFYPLSGKTLSSYPPRTAVTGNLLDGDGAILDTAVTTLYRAPRSYTGEDMAEFSCHGGLVVLSQVIARLCELGAVPAARGEYTLRAFLNGKMDLTQSEAVIDIISAKSPLAARQAFLQAGGALKNRLREIRGQLLDLDASIMVYVDYAAEDIDPPEPGMLLAGLEQAFAELRGLLKSYETGRQIKNGIDTAICGRPNVGKSSVMNLLCGERRSIVTELAGTTRDVVESAVVIAGLPLNLWDTAGLRETDHPVEQIGVQLARERLERADFLLCVFDGSAPLTPEDQELFALASRKKTVAVINKSDLPQRADRNSIKESFAHVVEVSAITGSGLAELEHAIAAAASDTVIDPQELYLSNLRQFGTLSEANRSMLRFKEALESGIPAEIAEADLREALRLIGEVTGETVTDDLIDRIFENFCVGK